MKQRWVVAGLLHVGVYTVVEAESRAGALKIAQSRVLRRLCAKCRGAKRNEDQLAWCFGEEIRGDVDDLALYSSDAKAAETKGARSVVR